MIKKLFGRTGKLSDNLSDKASQKLGDKLDQFPTSMEFYPPSSLAVLRNYQGYSVAKPFPHLMIDNFFHPEVLGKLLDDWPEPSEMGLEVHDDGTFSKQKYRFGPRTPYSKLFLNCFSEPEFLEALEVVTEIENLIPDPYHMGAAFHFTSSGGKLAIHADFNKHHKFELDRRLNILVYLNQNWQEEYGGHLELWNREMKSCEQKFLPIFNRLVLFSTTDFSYHGQPEPITAPVGMARRSIALYYFTNGRPEHELSPTGEHSTLWRERPGLGF